MTLVVAPGDPPADVMTAPTVGRLATLMADLDPLDGIPLSDAERLALQWLAVVPAFTRADLAAAVRESRTETVR